MRKEEKNQLIDSLTEHLNNNEYIYFTNVSGLDSKSTSDLRRLCFKRNIKLIVVKNTLLNKAMEKADKKLEEFYPILKGPTSIMFGEAGKTPAKLIKDFRKSNKSEKPLLKGAYIEEACYIGEDQLENLFNIKSKNELIGDIIGLLQSPAKNVISALQSSGQTLSGVLKTLSEKSE